jgi:hypothetical protein
MIDAPQAEWLSLEDAALYLGLSVGEFEDRVAVGVFPQGSNKSLRESQWHWQTVQALSWSRPWLDGLYVSRKREESERLRAARRAKAAGREDSTD